MLKLLFSSATSACFELKDDVPYYAPEKFTIYLNKKPLRE